MPKIAKNVPAYYWDACIFISYIDGIADRISTIDAILEDGENENLQIFTSILSITEVAFGEIEKIGKVLTPESEEKIDRFWLHSPVKLVDIHQQIAFDAKALIRETLPRGWSLKPADAIHLVTAKRMGVSEFHTYDDKLSKYAEIMDYKIVEPHTDKFKFLFPS